MNFTFQLTDQERQDIARALGHLIRALTNGIPKDSAKHQQVEPLFPDFPAGSKIPAEAASDKRRAAATALLAPPSVAEQMPPRDRWSDGATITPAPESYTVRIWKCEQRDGKTGPFLDVTWGSRADLGHQPRRAFCHAKELFPWILKASKTREQIILYLVQQDNFQKIVGVRA